MISDNIINIRSNIGHSFRSDPSIRILAVSKTHSSDKIREAYQAGISEFGENYLQEALPKIEALNDLEILWHFIGPIQSNKCREIAKRFAWVQSVDRLKIVKKLNAAAALYGKSLNILIQVNIDDEKTKHGVHPDLLGELANEVKSMSHLTLRGLMCIPKPESNPKARCQSFIKMQRLYDDLQCQGFALDTLSMGMSDDYLEAISSGANLIRIGSGIFGMRR